ncbi:dTMP kinase [Sinosporangium album]|uniref:dTMP kinase n=1 Tax=Sinosporangium album TaxID=504805 RepID=A0A1G8KYI5_9ACTN|nr:hypothetical protein [Sinosporangium album]SDI48441.1 dTMP kinase [Sinosporangium album]
MIIGLEGVSCTGKSTLASGLADRLGNISVVPCYYHSAPAPSMLPVPHVTSEAEQLSALAVHLEIEKVRLRHAQEALATRRRIVLDRTVDTLLAHLRAVGAMKGLNTGSRARTLVNQQINKGLAMVPHVTLLLIADHEVLTERARTRTDMPSLYYDPVFARAFCAHFRNPIAPVCLPLSAALPAAQVLDQACQLLEPYLGGSR